MSSSEGYTQNLDQYPTSNQSQNQLHDTQQQQQPQAQQQLSGHNEEANHPELMHIKQEDQNMTIDDIDKMISESINQEKEFEDAFQNSLAKRSADAAAVTNESDDLTNKRLRHNHDEHHNIEKDKQTQDIDFELDKVIEEHLHQNQQNQSDPTHNHLNNEHFQLQDIDGLHLEVQQPVHLLNTHTNQDASYSTHVTNNHHQGIPDHNNFASQEVSLDSSEKATDKETAELQMIANELSAATNPPKDPHQHSNLHQQGPETVATQPEQSIQPVDPSISQIQEVQQLQNGSTQETLHLSADNLNKSNQHNDKEPAEKPRLVMHEGIAVPADSELLNTSSALAAYNALSTQLPPLVTLTGAHLAALPLSITCPDYLPPRIQLLVNTLPTLDNLASQLLRIVAKGPYQKILDLVAQHDTPAGATYRDLTSLFEFTKKLYSEEDPFLTVEHIAPGMWKAGEKTPAMFRSREQSIELTLRKVNLATFLGATLGTIEVGFFYLNESFLDVFCPANDLDPENSLSNMSYDNMRLQSGINCGIGEFVGKLMKPQSVLYLDLKTQAFISAVEAGDRSREEILEDIIPSNLNDVLLLRRGTKVLTPTEHDFLERCKTRKELLLKYTSETRDLSEEYEWLTFLKELFEYSSKNMGFLIWGRKGRLARDKFSDTSSLSKDELAKTPHSQELLAAEKKIREEQEEEAERRRVHDAIRAHDYNGLSKSLLPSEIQEQQIHLRINPQSNIRNAQRRLWTREEEKALRHALELKGPQWSTILEYFGAGGKISEALKNRTQVQLKDKARNWKMFFLKAGLPVPDYLQKVTGDLERDDKFKMKQKRNLEAKGLKG